MLAHAGGEGLDRMEDKQLVLAEVGGVYTEKLLVSAEGGGLDHMEKGLECEPAERKVELAVVLLAGERVEHTDAREVGHFEGK